MTECSQQSASSARSSIGSCPSTTLTSPAHRCAATRFPRTHCGSSLHTTKCTYAVRTAKSHPVLLFLNISNKVVLYIFSVHVSYFYWNIYRLQTKYKTSKIKTNILYTLTVYSYEFRKMLLNFNCTQQIVSVGCIGINRRHYTYEFILYFSQLNQ